MIEIELSKDEILDYISELDIFKFYCSNFRELDKPFCSELREDPKPSCRISLRDGFYLYKDFGESISNNCFGYVMRKYNCTYRDALIKICNDFNILDIRQNISYDNNKKVTAKIKKNNKESKSNNTIIKIKKRKWHEIDYNFWTLKYGIKLETCELFNVYPISHFWINDILYSTLISNSYAYYYYKNDIHRYKIYQPYNKKNKWFSNIDRTIIQGVKNIPKSGENLIITKSLKDIMCLYELGFNSVAANNESSFIPEININKFKERFKNIYIYFDNDACGINHGKLFAEKYDLKQILNPEGFPKDISDLYHYRGKEEAINVLNQLIK